MTLRYVEHRGKLALREVGGHRWGENQRHVEKSNRLKSRAAATEVEQMIKQSANNPVERILVGIEGHWTFDLRILNVRFRG